IHDPNRLQQPRDSQGGKLPGQHRLAPGSGNEGLGSEVVDLVRFSPLQSGDQRTLVQKIARDKLDFVLQVFDAFEIDSTATTDKPAHPVVLLEKKLSKIGSVLTRNSCNKGFSLHFFNREVRSLA